MSSINLSGVCDGQSRLTVKWMDFAQNTLYSPTINIDVFDDSPDEELVTPEESQNSDSEYQEALKYARFAKMILDRLSIKDDPLTHKKLPLIWWQSLAS